MAWITTVDERTIGASIIYRAGSYDAPYTTSTTYKIAPRAYAYGALIPISSVADKDAYSLGILSLGTYAAFASGYNWDTTNLTLGSTPTALNLNDSTGAIIATSSTGVIYFNITQADTYYLSVVGSNYSSSEYSLIYTPNDIGTVTINLNGTKAVGNSLNALYTVVDNNGASNISPSFQWERSSDGVNWINIQGEVSQSYVIKPIDALKYLRVEFAYTDNDGFIEDFISQSTTVIAPDTISPTLTQAYPKNGSIAGVSANISLLFSENLIRGSGNILLEKNDGTIVEVYGATNSTNINISGSLLQINPTSDLYYDTQYKIVFDSNAVTDLSGNPYVQATAYTLNTVSPSSVATPSASSFPLTGGNSLIDAMTNGYKWILSANRTIDWSISRGFANEYWNDPDAVVLHVKAILDIYSYYSNIKFNFLGYFNSPTDAAQYGSEINISMDGANRFFSDNNFWAKGFFPNGAYDATLYNGAAGDIYLNLLSQANSLPSYEPGSAGWALIIHELGHTLGLKHPHDDGGTGRPTFNALGIAGLNIDWATVMSYNDNANFNLISWDPATPMILDVLALQYLYGKNNLSNAGDTIFNLTENNSYYTLWDASGVDLLSAAGASTAWTICLPNKPLTSLVDTNVGFAAPTNELTGVLQTMVWLAGNFENATGSDFNDYIIGNDLGNILDGGSGDDTINGGGGNNILIGGAGTDVAELSGSRSDYNLSFSKVNDYANYTYCYKVTSVSGNNYLNVLLGIENIKFSDGVYSLSDLLPPDLIGPTAMFSPADEASGVAVNSNIVLDFSEAIKIGTGKIIIKKSSGAVIATYDITTSTNIDIAGSTLTINPTADLDYSTSYKVEFAAGSITDLTGNIYAGTTSYNFTTDIPPVATAASASTNEDTAKTGTLAGTDADGNTLTFSKATDPTHGTVTVNAATGEYTYTPAANYNGSDSFTFKVNDGTVDSVAASVSLTINAVNDAPILVTPLGDQQVTVNQTLSFSFPVQSFADVDNASLAFTAKLASGAVLPDWLTFHPSDLSFTASPPPAVIGTDPLPFNIQVTATDTAGASVSDNFELLVTPSGYNINAKAIFWKGAFSSSTPTALSGVSLTEGGKNGVSGTTGFIALNGVLDADGADDGNMTLAPQLDAPSNAKSAITLTDVLAALKVYLNKPLPDAYASPLNYIAADFDGSGTVTLTDVLQLLKYYLNKPTSATPTWQFVDAADMSTDGKTFAGANGANLAKDNTTPHAIDQTFDATQTSIELVGVLRGDVDGSWTA